MGDKNTTLFELHIHDTSGLEVGSTGGRVADTAEKLGLGSGTESSDEGESEESGGFSVPFGSAGEEREADEGESEIESESEEDEEEESSSAMSLLVGLVFLVVLAAAAKKFAGEDELEDVELSEYETEA